MRIIIDRRHQACATGFERRAAIHRIPNAQMITGIEYRRLSFVTLIRFHQPVLLLFRYPEACIHHFQRCEDLFFQKISEPHTGNHFYKGTCHISGSSITPGTRRLEGKRNLSETVCNLHRTISSSFSLIKSLNHLVK